MRRLKTWAACARNRAIFRWHRRLLQPFGVGHAIRSPISLALMLLVAALARPALAQDEIRRMYPHEISVADLDLYTRLLNLSEEQQAAVAVFRIAYAERFDELRRIVLDAPVEPLGSEATLADFSRFREGYARLTETNRDKIRRLDRDFLLDIETMLHETQLEAMRRVRDHRERRVLRVNPLFYRTGKVFHDLTKFAYDLTLDNEDHARLDPILRSYERDLTARLMRIHELNLKIDLEPLAEVVRRGHGNIRLNEDHAEVWRESNEDVWATTGVRCLEAVSAVDELNEVTSQRIAATLSPEGRHRWLDKYLRYAFEDASYPRHVRRAMLDALQATRGVTETDHQRFGEVFAAIESRLFRIERELITLERPRRKRRPPYNAPEPEMSFEEYFEVRERLVVETMTLAREEIAELMRDAMRPVIFDQWHGVYADATERKDNSPKHPDGQGIQQIYDSKDPAPSLQRRDVDRIARTLALNGEQRARLDEAFENTQTRRKAIDRDLPMPPPDKYSEQPPLSAEALSRLRAADGLVFAALEDMLEDDERAHGIAWFRNIQLRRRLSHGISIGMAAGFDASVFMLDTGLSDEELAQLGPLLDTYDERADPILRRIADMRRQEHQAELDGREGREVNLLLFGRRDIHREVARLNLETVRAAAALLESDSGDAMLDVFCRIAFYYIYRDQQTLHTALKRVALLEDLTGDQRDRLLDLRVTYLEEYERLRAAMIDVVADSLFWLVGDSGSIPEQNDAVAPFNRLRFDRRQLNATTNVTLRSILTPDQIESIGGLPELK